MHFSRLLLTAAIVGALTVPGFAAPGVVDAMHNAMSNTEIDLNLSGQNGSKQDGQATIKDVSGGVMVKVNVKNEPAGASEPAHIHMGTCKNLNPAPYKPLNNVMNGQSVTTIHGLSVAQLKKAKYAINLHESASNLKHYVSCGDL